MEDRRLADVLDYLRQLGATEDQLAAAAISGEPARLALDIVLSRTLTLTTRDVAREVGIPVAEVLRVAGDMGMTIDDPDARRFSEDDIELVRLAQEMGGGLSHVVASSFARIAEASVAMYIKDVDPRLANPRDNPPVTLRTLFENFRIRIRPSPTATDELSIAKANVAAAEMALRAANSLRSAFLHALLDAVQWQRLTHSNASEPMLSRVAVGFVDLVRFTSMSRDMTVDELTALVVEFEATAFHLASRHGGRVVKHVGDEVMFVAFDALTGARLAADIVRAFCEQGICPRGGVAFGDTLAIHGDYYGSVVNLASRLADVAIPGEVLVEAATAAAVEAAHGVVESAGRRMLKGFDQPVPAFTFVSADPPDAVSGESTESTDRSPR